MFALLLAIIYLSFISLGLPDPLLGAAWPTIYTQFGVPVSFAGIISLIISVGTIISSLFSDRLTRRLGSGLLTALSVLTTAIAMLGFSFSTKFWHMLILAVPYGLGAGGVDACLNNYVALHLKSRHMSWLHCMWGVGAVVSPYIMGYALTGEKGWHQGYLIVAIIQFVLSALIIFSLPVWKKQKPLTDEPTVPAKPMTLKQIFTLRGAVPYFIMFFCYCALEQTTMLWSSSYFVLNNGISPEKAANYASLFCIGMTVGRAVNGFLTIKFSDRALIRGGSAIVFVGLILLFLPFGDVPAIIALIVMGVGCAPIYPSIIHNTPALFGADKSQAIIGVQMASAYTGVTLMPPLFGLLANHIGVRLLPYYVLFFLIIMVVMHEVTNKIAVLRPQIIQNSD